MYASGTLHEFHPRSSSAATSSVPRARGKSSGQSRRWLTEASEAFSYYVPLPMPCDAATLCDASAAVTMLPAELVAEHGIDPAQFSDVDKLFRDDAPQLVNESTQTEAAVTGMKSVLKKAQEEAVAAMRRKREAERRQREKMGSSRFLADSAFVRLHHKPAFHAYGVGNRAPLVDSQYLASFSVNPLLHPATDKGQLLLKLPRKQVHDTAVMHAHIEATKFNGERAEEEAGAAASSGSRHAASPGAQPKLMINARQEELSREVSLAIRAEKRGPRRAGSASATLRGHGDTTMPAAPPRPPLPHAASVQQQAQPTSPLASSFRASHAPSGFQGHNNAETPAFRPLRAAAPPPVAMPSTPQTARPSLSTHGRAPAAGAHVTATPIRAHLPSRAAPCSSARPGVAGGSDAAHVASAVVGGGATSVRFSSVHTPTTTTAAQSFPSRHGSASGVPHRGAASVHGCESDMGAFAAAWSGDMPSDAAQDVYYADAGATGEDVHALWSEARVASARHAARGRDSSALQQHLTWDPVPMPTRAPPTAQPVSAAASFRRSMVNGLSGTAVQGPQPTETRHVTVLNSAGKPTMVPVVLRSFAQPPAFDRDPRVYKFLPPTWTNAIRPAGMATGVVTSGTRQCAPESVADLIAGGGYEDEAY